MLNKLLGLMVLVCAPLAVHAGETPKLQDVRYFIGTWSCVGQYTCPKTQKVYNTVGKWKIDSRRGGKVIHDHFINHADNGKTYRAAGWSTFCPKDGMAHRLVVNNKFGGAKYTSAGWQEDKFVWAGSYYGPFQHGVAVQEAITRIDDNSIQLRVAGHVGEPEETAIYKGSCTRDGIPANADEAKAPDADQAKAAPGFMDMGDDELAAVDRGDVDCD